MMLPVRRNPEERAPLERHRPAHREEVFERLRRPEPAVRVQAVVAQADAEADRDPVQREGDEEVGPRKPEEGRDRQRMEGDHEQGGDPVDGGEGIGRPDSRAQCRQRWLLNAWGAITIAGWNRWDCKTSVRG